MRVVLPGAARFALALTLGLLGLTPVQASATAGPAERFNYVALGDSYSSGEGVWPYADHTDTTRNSCHRSLQNYPQLLVEWLSDEEAPYAPASPLPRPLAGSVADGFVDVTCAGAKVEHVVDADHNEEAVHNGHAQKPGQLNHPALAGADLVTITVGGNDVEFSKVLGDCMHPAADPLWDCQDDVASWGPYVDMPYRRVVDLLFERLRLELDGDPSRRERGLYSLLGDAAPNATVYVLGYPHLVPASREERDCVKLSGARGALGGLIGQLPVVQYGGDQAKRLPVPGSLLSDSEAGWIREQTTRLNALVQQLAEKNGLHFVDTAARFAGHEICGKDGEWINGPSLLEERADGSWQLIPRQAFHPTPHGQRQLADAVVEQVGRQLSSGMPTRKSIPVNPGEVPPVADALALAAALGDDRMHCTPLPASPLLPTDVQCARIVRADLDGDALPDWLLLALQGSSAPNYLVRAILAGGTNSQVILQEPDDGPEFDVATLQRSIEAGPRFFEGDDRAGVEFWLDTGAGAHSSTLSLLSLESGTLGLVADDDGPVHTTLEDSAQWVRAFPCVKDVNGDAKPDLVEYVEVETQAPSGGATTTWQASAWQWDVEWLDRPGAVAKSIKRVRRVHDLAGIVTGGRTALGDCRLLALSSYVPLPPPALTPEEAAVAVISGWKTLPNTSYPPTAWPSGVAAAGYSEAMDGTVQYVPQELWSVPRTRELRLTGCTSASSTALCKIGDQERAHLMDFLVQRMHANWLVIRVLPPGSDAGPLAAPAVVGQIADPSGTAQEFLAAWWAGDSTRMSLHANIGSSDTLSDFIDSRPSWASYDQEVGCYAADQGGHDCYAWLTAPEGGLLVYILALRTDPRGHLAVEEAMFMGSPH